MTRRPPVCFAATAASPPPPARSKPCRSWSSLPAPSRPAAPCPRRRPSPAAPGAASSSPWSSPPPAPSSRPPPSHVDAAAAAAPPHPPTRRRRPTMRRRAATWSSSPYTQKFRTEEMRDDRCVYLRIWSRRALLCTRPFARVAWRCSGWFNGCFGCLRLWELIYTWMLGEEEAFSATCQLGPGWRRGCVGVETESRGAPPRSIPSGHVDGRDIERASRGGHWTAGIGRGASRWWGRREWRTYVVGKWRERGIFSARRKACRYEHGFCRGSPSVVVVVLISYGRTLWWSHRRWDRDSSLQRQWYIGIAN